MACAGCTTCGTGEKANGCKNNGCSTGGCNRLNTYDWISAMEIEDVEPYEVIEVSFKNGARKDFFINPPYTRTSTGDVVVVETGGGYDIGTISLSGELVRLQLKKKKIKSDTRFHRVIRKANERDLEKLQESRNREKLTMIKARAIARTLALEMKVGDVEFQGDGRKATFYYTADGRVDFRELIRHYAREFKVKIEMRQIGARQESARIGGLGSCGRELCCSTWLTEFKSVTTSAARYQNLAINQAKLSGQCGRLKCCLNYELDTYMEAFREFPQNAEKLETQTGRATLFKIDIFNRLMYYMFDSGQGRGKNVIMKPKDVKEILAMNKRGEKPVDLLGHQVLPVFEDTEKEADMEFDDVSGEIELPVERKKKKKKRKGRRNRGQQKGEKNQQSSQPKKDQPQNQNQNRNKNRNKSRNKNRSRKGGLRDGQDGGKKKD